MWVAYKTGGGRRIKRRYAIQCADLAPDCSELRSREKPDLYQTQEAEIRGETKMIESDPESRTKKRYVSLPCVYISAFFDSLLHSIISYILGNKKGKEKKQIFVHQYCCSSYLYTTGPSGIQQMLTVLISLTQTTTEETTQMTDTNRKNGLEKWTEM